MLLTAVLAATCLADTIAAVAVLILLTVALYPGGGIGEPPGRAELQQLGRWPLLDI